MPQHILFVVNHAGFFLSHRLPLALAAKERGYRVSVTTPESKHVAVLKSHGIEWHPLRLSRSGIHPLGELRTIGSLYSLYRRLRPDVVHHVSSKPVLYGTPVARLARVPGVVNAISGMGHVFAGSSAVLRSAVSLLYRVALNHPHMRVVFQNLDHLGMFVDRGWVDPAEAVIIRGSGVDMEAFHPHPPADREHPVVIFPARMLTTKGVGEFVDAVRILRARGIEAEFRLVGEPDPDNLASLTEAQLRAWADEGLVRYYGRRSDMPEMLNEADIACLPSYHEGMPKSLIEAAACGLPIVTTDVPGCRDVVVHEKTGFLVKPRSSEEVADALATLISDASLRRSMGLRGRQRAEEMFSLDSVVNSFMALYSEMLP